MASIGDQPRPWWRRWPEWSGYAAAAWSFGYAALGAFWWSGGAGFPYGPENDPSSQLSILAWLRAPQGAAAVAIVGLVSGFGALAMTRVPHGSVRPVLLTLGVVMTVTLALLIPDYRVLMATAYTPIFLLGAPFGWPPGVNVLQLYPWPVVNQLLCIAGGLLWGAATLAYARRSGGACAACGRSDDVTSLAADSSRWGRWATYLAVAIPIVYALTRWAWALGIPLGISEEFLREGEASGAWWAGAALATVAVAGAVLTIGLIRPWGEIFPRWFPFIGGRRVPPALAVVPATLVAVVVTSAGIMFWRLTLGGGFELGVGDLLTLEDAWAALLPELLWPFWGIALGAATLSYHNRRRGRCAACGRGA